MSTKIAISQFKTHCLQIIDKLQTNHQSVIITKRDKVIAKVVSVAPVNQSLFGMLKGKAEIKGNIIDSTNEEWEAENE